MGEKTEYEETLLRPASDFTEKVVKRFHPADNETIGDPFHWGKLPFRVIPGETSLWSGYNGHGKSIFLNQCILEQGVIGRKSVLASFEMPAVKNLYRMVRQALGKVDPTKEEIEKCMEWLGKRVFVYDKTGIGSLKNLKIIFNQARTRFGATFFVIDSLMKCGIPPKDCDAQKKFMDEWQDYAQQYNVNINIVAHARKGESEEERPGKMDVAGASELTNLPDNVYSIWRNKKKEDQYRECYDTQCFGPKFQKLLLEYDCVVNCCKNRELGGDGEGSFGLYFQRPSMQFAEKCGDKPYIYFEP